MSTVTFASLPKADLLAVLDIIDGDGHTIFNAAAFEQHLPADLLGRFTTTHASDPSNIKSTLFDSGGYAVGEVRGVYGLSLLQAIAHSLKLPPSAMLGRGSEARDLDRRIRQALAQQ